MTAGPSTGRGADSCGADCPGHAAGAEHRRIWRTPAGVRLAPLGSLADPGARGFVLRIAGAYFHGFAVRQGDRVYGYADRCPHAGLPLARIRDGYLAPGGDLIACSWHGALFDAATGRCVGGPAAGSSLPAWPLAVVDGWICTAGSGSDGPPP